MDEKLILAVRSLKSDPNFRIVLRHLMDKYSPFFPAFDENPIVMARNCASQECGQHLMDLIGNADATLLYKLLSERGTTNEES